jgi:hypothetical protein
MKLERHQREREASKLSRASGRPSTFVKCSHSELLPQQPQMAGLVGYGSSDEDDSLDDGSAEVKVKSYQSSFDPECAADYTDSRPWINQ